MANKSFWLTKLTKSPFVIGTFDATFFWVSIKAFVASRAVSIFCEPPTLRHTPQIVLVKKFAGIAFLAQTT